MAPPCLQPCDPLAPPHTGISSPVKKTEMDKSPFNSPSPQDSPRLSSFTQHHRPVIAVHSGEHYGPWGGGGREVQLGTLVSPLQAGLSHRRLSTSPIAVAPSGQDSRRCYGRERPGLPVSLGPGFPFCMKEHRLWFAP